MDKDERPYDIFTLGWLATPLGFVGYMDCMREGDDEFDRTFLLPHVFATESQVKAFLEKIVSGMQDEFGAKRVAIV